jgi:hypothetical protein
MITNVSKRRCRSGSLSRSAASNASSTRRRISSASSSVFSPGAALGPLAMTEVGMGCTRRQNEVVERDPRTIKVTINLVSGLSRTRIDHHAPTDGINRARLSQQHLDILLAAQDPPNRRRDVAGRQRRRGHLIEERLK